MLKHETNSIDGALKLALRYVLNVIKNFVPAMWRGCLSPRHGV